MIPNLKERYYREVNLAMRRRQTDVKIKIPSLFSPVLVTVDEWHMTKGPKTQAMRLSVSYSSANGHI